VRAAANVRAACLAAHKSKIEDQVKCFIAIERPIWERDVPEGVKYYDEYQKKHLDLARAYDDEVAKPEVIDESKRAKEYWVSGITQALAEWRENAAHDIQMANEQDAAARANALQALGNIISALGEASLAVAQARAEQQSQPAHYNQQQYNFNTASQPALVAPNTNSKPTVHCTSGWLGNRGTFACDDGTRCETVCMPGGSCTRTCQ